MRGLKVPPLEEDFTADPVELFFDLAYVLAFSQLVSLLVHHPDWATFGKVLLLFVLMWLPWSQFTWAANAISGNGRAVRALFLVATAASIPMAASVSQAFESSGGLFSISLATIYLIALATISLSHKGGRFWVSVVKLSRLSVLGIGMIVVGGFGPEEFRIWIWLASLAVVAWTLYVAGSQEWVVRFGHMAERHGLIVIIALGEVIVAIGIAVVAALEDGAGLPAETLAVLLGAGLFAALTWWAYFDRLGVALEHRAESIENDIERGRYGRDVYTTAHAPIVAGVVVAAAGLEHVALHPNETVSLEFRALLVGGLALITFGTIIAVYRAFKAFPYERTAVTLALVAGLAAFGGSTSGWILLLIVDAVLLLGLVAEHLRIEKIQTT